MTRYIKYIPEGINLVPGCTYLKKNGFMCDLSKTDVHHCR